MQTWRRKAIGEASVFVPLRVEGLVATDNNKDHTNSARSMSVEIDASTRPGSLEIECGGIRIRFSGPVDATALRLVIMHIGRHA